MFENQFPTNNDLFKIFSEQKNVSPSIIEKHLRTLSEKSDVPILSRAKILKTKNSSVKYKKKPSKFHANDYHQNQQKCAELGPLTEIYELWTKFRDPETNMLPRRLEQVYKEYQKTHPNTPDLHATFDCFPKELHEAASTYDSSTNPNNQLIMVKFQQGTKACDLDFFIDQMSSRQFITAKETNTEYTAELAEKEEEELKMIKRAENIEKRRSNQYADYGVSTSKCSSSRRSTTPSDKMDVDDEIKEEGLMDYYESDDELAVPSKKAKSDLFNGSYIPGMIECYVRLVSDLSLSQDKALLVMELLQNYPDLHTWSLPKESRHLKKYIERAAGRNIELVANEIKAAKEEGGEIFYSATGL